MGQRGLIAQVPEQPTGVGPAWLAELRRQAATHLHGVGFPGKKHEAWRFTSVRDVVDTEFVRSDEARDAAAFVRERLGEPEGYRVVVTDGRPTLDGAPPDGVTVERLADVLQARPEALEGLLGQIAPNEQFAALNGALFVDGLLVRVRKGATPDTPVHVVHVAGASETPRAAYPRLLVLADESSEATLIEEFLTAPADGRHLVDAVTEVRVGANARLRHLRIVHGDERAHHLAYLAAHLGRDAFFGSHVVTLGGALSRLELTVRFLDKGSEAELDGVYHVDREEHVDHQIRVEHAAAHCTSRVRYRGLLSGRGHAVFNAIGIADRVAEGTQAHQENRNLLLSPDAVIDTKPHLEIDTDDISASHGATIGALDETQLFYLRSRGITAADAREMLTVAFVAALLDRIPEADTALRASAAVLRRLGQEKEALA